MSVSQNGWPASKDRAAIDVIPFSVVLSSGTKTVYFARNAGPSLVEVAEWWDKNIEPITEIGGHNFREIRGKEGTGKLSNHSSGTAVDINWSKHPFGSANTVTPEQAQAIRAKVGPMGLRWGGDYKRTKDEHHVEVNFNPTLFNNLVVYNEEAAAALNAASDFIPVDALPAAIGAGTAAGIVGGLAAYKYSSKDNKKRAVIAFLGAGTVVGLIVMAVQSAGKEEGD